MKSKIIIFTLFFLIICGCKNEDERWLSFIGDSEVARWDLQFYFPNLLTENKGKSASGIDYIKSMAYSMTGKDVVVLFGTNDIYKLTNEAKLNEYVAEYINAITSLNADNTYLISIFPRNFNNEGKGINKKIEELNDRIKQEAIKQNITFVDVYSKLLKDESINMQYSYDGLHLNNYGYELLTYELNKYLK
ncbi:MAG: SGNH/GDSL hydrolase family protein [Bacteroidales bacterium]|nr:SGNH/GDSL hydrolase family protein [Bacteroidales bacterium]